MARSSVAGRESTNGNGHVNRIAGVEPAKREVVIAPPNYQTAVFTIRGTSPYVQEAFGDKQRKQIMATQAAGDAAKKKGKKREPRNFDADYKSAMHVSTDGWHGIPASAFRSAMIATIRTTTGITMAFMKQAAFVIADGYDAADSVPLVRITKGKPHRFDQPLKNSNGSVDIRVRPMFDPGWEAVVQVKFDADVLSLEDVASMLSKAGVSVGIGAGRWASKMCGGLGWGCFEITK